MGRKKISKMSFASIFMAMVKLFLILIVGWVCQRGGLFPEGTQAVLTKLVVYVTTPCTILYSVLNNEGLPGTGEILMILGISLCCYVVILALSAGVVRLLRVAPGSRGAYICMLLCSNCGFIGYPVVQSIFGQQAVFYTAIFNIPFYPFLYVLGALLLQRDGAILRGESTKFRVKVTDILGPCMIASILAVLLAVTGLSIPGVLTDTVGLLGDITTPGALLAIGISIARQPLKTILGSVRIYIVTLLRLVVLPALVWLVLHFFLKDPTILGVAVVIFGMPVAASVPMLASEYQADEVSTVQSVFITTVLSMITIPLLVTLLNAV